MNGFSKFARRVVHGVKWRARDAFWRAVPGADAQAFEMHPSLLILEFTNLCNANCVFCPYSKQLRAHQQMSEPVFKKAVAEYVAMGGGPVEVTPPVGDPLIHPKFVEWMRYLRSFPQIDRIGISTNGILLDRHGVEEVLDCGVSRINISMAGFDDAMYQRVYRNPGYEKVRRNVEALLRANSKREKPVSIFLQLRPDRPEADVLADPDFQPVLAYKPEIRFIEVLSRSGGMMNETPPGMVLAPLPKRQKKIACRKTFTAIVVQSDGNVQACGCESSINAPALVIGNIEQESLAEIWRGARLAALRDSFAAGCLNANCHACDYYYQPAGFHLPEMRKMAKNARRRMAGEIVRHEGPPPDDWVLE